MEGSLEGKSSRRGKNHDDSGHGETLSYFELQGDMRVSMKDKFKHVSVGKVQLVIGHGMNTS